MVKCGLKLPIGLVFGIICSLVSLGFCFVFVVYGEALGLTAIARLARLFHLLLFVVAGLFNTTFLGYFDGSF